MLKRKHRISTRRAAPPPPPPPPAPKPRRNITLAPSHYTLRVTRTQCRCCGRTEHTTTLWATHHTTRSLTTQRPITHPTYNIPLKIEEHLGEPISHCHRCLTALAHHISTLPALRADQLAAQRQALAPGWIGSISHDDFTPPGAPRRLNGRDGHIRGSVPSEAPALASPAPKPQAPKPRLKADTLKLLFG